jgi:hypothetical protein
MNQPEQLLCFQRECSWLPGMDSNHVLTVLNPCRYPSSSLLNCDLRAGPAYPGGSHLNCCRSRCGIRR